MFFTLNNERNLNFVIQFVVLVHDKKMLVAANLHDFVSFTQSSLFVGFHCHLVWFFHDHVLCLRFRAKPFREVQIG